LGRDVNGLVTLLTLNGHEVRTTAIGHAPPRLIELPETAQRDVLTTYYKLGGTRSTPNLRPGSWDLVVDGVLVELDEQLHFNRYRALTLEVASYTALPRFPLTLYRAMCAARESDCLKHGCGQQRWMNASTELHFGPSAPRGDLAGGGASRWKQRALYDLMKDLTQLDPDHPRLARLSIYDELPGDAGTTLEAATHRGGNAELARAVSLIIEDRAGVRLAG
jgi:hypothetical protein